MGGRIYLAGKVGGSKWSIVKPFLGLCDFVASDGGHYGEHGGKDHGWEKAPTPGGWEFCNNAYKYFAEARALGPIREATALIAYLNTKDSLESIAEIAYASAIGKECHVLIQEERTEDEEIWDYLPLYDSYWFVCSFPNVSVYCVDSEADAIERLGEILEGYGFGCGADSYIYFIEAVDKGEIKIGLAANPDKRLAELQTGNAARLRLLAKVPGGRKDEARFHKKFSHLRLHGEWFRDSGELRAFIADLNAQTIT